MALQDQSESRSPTLHINLGDKMEDPSKELYLDKSQHTNNMSQSSTPGDLEKASQPANGPVVPNEQSTATESPAEAPKPPPNPMGNVPNGGVQAWLQVLCGFMLFFNTWGVLNTFGIYQTYYESGALFHETSSNISWIGAIQSYCLLLIGLFSGPVYDRGHLRLLLLLGSFGVIFGHMMLSLCTTYWQALLAQGFCVGLGAGCLFIPAVAILPTYFNTRLGLAVGLAASGSSLGGVIYPIVFYKLVDQVGFGWSTRIIGFIALATQLIPIFLMRQRVKPAKPRDLIDWTAFTDWPYMTFVLACIIGFIGLYTGLFYISYYAEAKPITDAKLAFYLIPILNAASIFGRTVPNAISDKTGPLNLIAPGGLICGALILSLIGVNSVAWIIVVAILFGFFSGLFIAIPPVCFVILTKDKSKIGTRIGMGFAMIGFGVLCGGPGGGAVLGNGPADLHWTQLWLYGGICFLACGCIMGALRVWRAGAKLMVKV